MHEGLKKCSHADSLRSVQLQILTNHKKNKEIYLLLGCWLKVKRIYNTREYKRRLSEFSSFQLTV